VSDYKFIVPYIYKYIMLFKHKSMMSFNLKFIVPRPSKSMMSRGLLDH